MNKILRNIEQFYNAHLSSMYETEVAQVAARRFKYTAAQLGSSQK